MLTVVSQERWAEASAQFAPDPSSVRDARRFVVTTLIGWGLDHLDDAALLTSELAANAVIHARTSYAIAVSRSEGRVRIGVRDGSASGARRCRYGATAATGRGIGMVADLSDSWGVEQVDGGKRVWFEMSITTGEEMLVAPNELPLTVGGDVDLDALLQQLRGAGDDAEGSSPSAELCVR